MDGLSEHERALERELTHLARRHPPYPRAWAAEVKRRATWPGWDELDAIESLREEHGFVSPAPATMLRLVDAEKRYLTAFEPDELLPETTEVPARSSAD